MFKEKISFEESIIVKYSAIHGYGIFTNIDIQKGSLIMKIEGEIISEDECVRREEEDNNVYIFWNGENYIDTINTEKIKYINHHCDPNCEVLDGTDEYLLLFSRREIKAGEEITIDYGYDEIYEICSCSACT